MKNFLKQKGQAMVFGLIFMAVVVVTLLMLYNQGQLVRNRIQVENAADAAVYSQAKLAARNQNFISYTNRAMVANEVSIGQMVALASWARHYAVIPTWTLNYPLYQFPIAPPSPVTFAQVLSAVTTPIGLVGTALEVPAKAMVGVWPSVVSYFNMVVGVFQKMFMLATLEAQIEAGIALVEDYEFVGDADPDARGEDGLYVPVIGWYFLVQNTLLTYFGDNFDPGNLVDQIGANSDSDLSASAQDLAKDYLGENGLSVETMIQDNSPAKVSKKSGETGPTAENNGDDVVEAYERFAAIVNGNRDAWTENRHWDLGVGDSFGFGFDLDFGIVAMKIELDLGFWMGIKNDGGTAYRSATFAVNDEEEVESYGWSSMDVISMGVEFSIGLFVEIKICLFGSCTKVEIIDIDFTIPIGFPLGGATQQAVSELTTARKLMPEWGFPGMHLLGFPGGDMYGEAFDLFHLQTDLYGNIAQGTGMYGANVSRDVKDSYSGPPAFYSLGEGFQESKTSYEFAVAVAKRLEEVPTTDSDTFGIRDSGGEDRCDEDDRRYTRLCLETHSGAEDSTYQQVIWHDEAPMMTVSSAETYYQNMDHDAGDVGSLFSPYWDARLREPSVVTNMLATGEINWQDMIPGLSGSDTANFIIEWVLTAIGEKIVESAAEYAGSKADAPWDTYVERAVEDAATPVMEAGVEAATDALSDYVPDF